MLENKEEKSTVKEQKNPTRNYIVMILTIAALLLVSLFVLSNSVTVPFSTFKNNLNNAPRISVTVTYSNLTQYAQETPCFSSMIQVLSHSRKASTIDFFLVNQTSCTYSRTGLGGQVVPVTTSSSYCLNIANSETTIFLNYSSSNRTVITQKQLYVYGNSAYMQRCPIAVELG